MHGEVGRLFGELCTREKPDEQFGLIRNVCAPRFNTQQPIATCGRQREARSPDGRETRA
jgi:hypothetical protein